MPDPSTVYPIRDEGETVTLYPAWGVYKDYDGCAPDGPVQAVCSRSALARLFARVVSEVDDSLAHDRPDDDRHGPTVRGDEPMTEEQERIVGCLREYELLLPVCEGYEYSAFWSFKNVKAERHKIAETLWDAMQQLIDSRE